MNVSLLLMLQVLALVVGGWLWGKLFSYARGWVADLKPGPLRDFFNVKVW